MLEELKTIRPEELLHQVEDALENVPYIYRFRTRYSYSFLFLGFILRIIFSLVRIINGRIKHCNISKENMYKYLFKSTQNKN